MNNLPTRAQLQDDPFGFRDKYRDYQRPRGGQSFDPSYDAKVNNLARGREPMRVGSASSFDPSSDAKANNGNVASRAPMRPAQAFDASADHKANSRAQMPVGDSRSPLNGGTDLDKMQQNFMRFAANTKNSAEIEQKAQADSQAAQPNRYLGDEGAKLAQVARSSGYRPPIATSPSAPTAKPEDATAAKVDPSKNAWVGNYAAADASGQGVYTDPETGRTSLRLTGEAGNKFMQEQDKAIAEGKGVPTTADSMAARRKAMGEYGGMFKQDAQEIPRTARPGITLQSTPVEYKREVAGPKTVSGLPAEETFTPQPAQQQRAAMPTMTGNPLVDQRNMEAALQRRQMEVMQAERNDPTLLQAPGSRDYIDPRLTEPEQRARQLEITAQRTQDMRDVRDRIVAETQAQDAALAAKGLPTVEARNRAMEPYAERRATINQRGATASTAQEQERTKATVADNAATRDAEMKKAEMTDATTRQGQAIDQETNRINAEISAQSKAMDRETTLKAALLKAENTKDPVLLKKLDGYNSWLESVMAMGQTPTPEQMTEAQKTYGVAELFAAADPYAKLTIPAPAQK